MMLTRYHSPFVTGERQPQFGDLCFAIWVCKRTWGQLMEGIKNQSFKKEIRFLYFISKFKRKGPALSSFVDYVTNSTNEPNLFFNKIDGQTPHSMNNLHFIKIILMSKLHLNKDEAMNLPFAEAIYDIAGIGESEGSCGFVTDAHIDAGESAKRQWEKMQTEKVKHNGKRN